MQHLRDLAARLQRSDLAVFFDFKRPPYGGGNQFLLALTGELTRRGVRIERNTLSPSARACLFNSFNFDMARLRALHRPDCRMVHRVDGPIGAYRGHDDGVDQRLHELNAAIADATVFQSRYSLEKHVELGLTFREPFVIMNAVDPRIFYPPPEQPPPPGTRKVRLISTAWSDNPIKGAPVYQWLDQHLDFERYEYTFLGRAQVRFEHIRMLDPLPSEGVARELRQHDVYITASLFDPCSNALLEALACGLPAVFANSGGHPEIVGQAGFGFDAPEEIPALLDRLVDEYAQRRALIAIPTLAQVADRYQAVFGLATAGA